MEDFHPQKPELVEPKPKTGWSLTIFSMVMFVLAFSLLFRDHIDFILYLLLVLIIHESGHYILMKLFDYKNVRMLFIPLMGAFVQGKKEKYSQKESFLVTMAGPFPGIIIGVILLIYSANNQVEWGLQLSALFLFLNIINLLPLDPLDGGQMFKLFIRKNFELTLLIFAFISSIVLIGIGFYLNSLLVMLFGFFMGFRVRALQKSYQMHKELKEESVEYRTTYKRLSNRDFFKIKEVIIEHTPALRKFMDQVSSDESDPIIASQVNNVLITPIVKDTSKFFRVLLVILWIAALIGPIVLFFSLDLSWHEIV